METFDVNCNKNISLSRLEEETLESHRKSSKFNRMANVNLQGFTFYSSTSKRGTGSNRVNVTTGNNTTIVFSVEQSNLGSVKKAGRFRKKQVQISDGLNDEK